MDASFWARILACSRARVGHAHKISAAKPKSRHAILARDEEA